MRNRFSGGIVATLLLAVASTGFGQSKDFPLAPNGVLRWGGDQVGGGPYIYPKEDNPRVVVGFEVDLAEAIGKELKLQPKFVQGAWDQLLPILSRGDLDMVMNGYEFTPERAHLYTATIPYYIYELNLLVRKNDSSITDWKDLKKPAPGGRKRRIGVLRQSGADKYASREYESSSEILRYDGQNDTMNALSVGQIDATIQDVPIESFYVERLGRYPSLHVVGTPVAPGYYVIYVDKKHVALADAINTAIQKFYADGTLKSIYQEYGIWNLTQEELPEVWKSWSQQSLPPAETTYDIIKHYIPVLINAAGITVLLSVISMPMASLLGMTVAILRNQGKNTALPNIVPEWFPLPTWVITAPLTFYVEIVRGTPVLFQLYVVYFVLPTFDIRLQPFWAGVIALAINYSAYESEIFRLGLQAIPRGQLEAALALGMTRWQAARRIIIPQAIRIVIPATANDFIALFKDTAVCAVIAVPELSREFQRAALSSGKMMEMALLTSILYLMMSYPLSLLAGWLERTLAPEEEE